MSQNRIGPGCGLIVIILLGIWIGYDTYVSQPNEKAKIKRELEEKWSVATVNYFVDFDCSKLAYKEGNHKIKKFFVIESHLDHPCEIKYSSNSIETFQNAKNINKYYSKNISDVNTIIWIQSVGGSSEANYTDGSPARRLIAEINFIDKKTNRIYKKQHAEFIGNPRDQITRSSRDIKGTDVYFGDKPYDKIFEIIETELNK